MFTIILLAACGRRQDVTVKITGEVINAGYIGNGVEWDPYDEASSWGSPLSDDDWNTLYDHLDFMRPAYVRCMINSPYRYYNDGVYDPERNMESVDRLLGYCQSRGIMVIWGEYNPPTWDMKEDQRWVDMSVGYLNLLVNVKGYDCIKHFVIFNEPDGDWASTDGDFDMWVSMARRFHERMAAYPGLLDKVSLAGPDVVADYRNAHSPFGTDGWLTETVAEADSIIGLYDIHSYPGQQQVLSGSYRPLLESYRKLIPADKKIVLGEAGYKYWREADSLLMAEYNRRLVDHPFTNGSDCNMLVYDNFYAIDMPVLISEVMNSGFSGVAAWMLDDAMHSQGDSGMPRDIKVWGMWNILGEEVFCDPKQELVRPWYYSWSLMCRAFPAGCDILASEVYGDSIFAVASRTRAGLMSVAVINVADYEREISLELPRAMNDVYMYCYSEGDGIELDGAGLPVADVRSSYPVSSTITLRPHSLVIMTELK